MLDNSSSNKKIAKNTLLLYLRMFYSLIISLFTARVVLNALGFEDYGLYNVVGSIVAMFGFIRTAMGNSVHRYITYSIGKSDPNETRKVFSMSVIIFVSMALLIILLCETIGLWFFYEKLVIPEGREQAAFWVYQCSIITAAITVICVPYDAVIIAHEHFNVFAFVQVLNTTLNLGVVYLVACYPYDKLVFYAIILLSIQIMNRVIYGVYCGKHFPETKFSIVKDIALLKEMTSFAGWSMIGNLAFICYSQGINILINLFFGPVVNAARAISVNVQGAVKGFVVNFQTAVNPQIIKSYANDDFSRLHSLVFSSSKFSFFLLYCFVLPICIETKTILVLWLKNVPDYTIGFTILTLIILLIEPLSNPIDKANQATGKIKTYQLVEGGCLLLILPIAYLVLKLGGTPYTVFFVQLIIMYSVQVLRLFLVCHKIKMSIREYLKKVIFKVCIVTIISAIVPLILHFTIPSTIWSFLLIVSVSIFSVLTCSYYCGLTTNEKIFVLSKCKKLIGKIATHLK